VNVRTLRLTPELPDNIKMTKIKKQKWALLIVAFVLIINAINIPPSMAVQGQTCESDADCPCWSEDMKGIGIGTCSEGKCDLTSCVDVGGVGDWFVKHPLQWMKSHPMYALLLVGLLFMIIIWPKGTR